MPQHEKLDVFGEVAALLSQERFRMAEKAGSARVSVYLTGSSGLVVTIAA